MQPSIANKQAKASGWRSMSMSDNQKQPSLYLSLYHSHLLSFSATTASSLRAAALTLFLSPFLALAIALSLSLNLFSKLVSQAARLQAV